MEGGRGKGKELGESAEAKNTQGVPAARSAKRCAQHAQTGPRRERGATLGCGDVRRERKARSPSPPPEGAAACPWKGGKWAHCGACSAPRRPLPHPCEIRCRKVPGKREGGRLGAHGAAQGGGEGARRREQAREGAAPPRPPRFSLRVSNRDARRPAARPAAKENCGRALTADTVSSSPNPPLNSWSDA